MVSATLVETTDGTIICDAIFEKNLLLWKQRCKVTLMYTSSEYWVTLPNKRRLRNLIGFVNWWNAKEILDQFTNTPKLVRREKTHV